MMSDTRKQYRLGMAAPDWRSAYVLMQPSPEQLAQRQQRRAIRIAIKAASCTIALAVWVSLNPPMILSMVFGAILVALISKQS